MLCMRGLFCVAPVDDVGVGCLRAGCCGWGLVPCCWSGGAGERRTVVHTAVTKTANLIGWALEDRVSPLIVGWNFEWEAPYTLT